MICKFCRCTDTNACRIGFIVDGDGQFLALPGELAHKVEPCFWIAPNICSAPACAERAYYEAWALIEYCLEVAA